MLSNKGKEKGEERRKIRQKYSEKTDYPLRM